MTTVATVTAIAINAEAVRIREGRVLAVNPATTTASTKTEANPTVRDTTPTATTEKIAIVATMIAGVTGIVVIIVIIVTIVGAMTINEIHAMAIIAAFHLPGATAILKVRAIPGLQKTRKSLPER